MNTLGTKSDEKATSPASSRWSLVLVCSVVAYVILAVHINTPRNKLALRADPSASMPTRPKDNGLPNAEELRDLLAKGIEILTPESGDLITPPNFSPLPADPQSKCPTAQEPSFTLATTATTEKLWLLQGLCERWGGPITVAVAIYPNQNLLHDSDLAWVSSCSASAAAPRLRIIPVLVSSRSQLPINRLRNFAINAATSTHFLLVDVDFTTSADLYPTLHRLYRDTKFSQAHTADHAMVIPAFEMLLPPLFNQRVPGPADKDELRRAVREGSVGVFHFRNVPDGHSSTPTDAWLPMTCSGGEGEGEGLHDMLPIPCVNSDNYEPYVVLQRCPFTPRFHEGFTGFGKNKIEFVRNLRFAGYRFSVMPCSFIVHNPHEPTSAQNYFMNHREDAQRKRDMMTDFVREMSANSQQKVGVCARFHCGLETFRSAMACPGVFARFVQNQLYYLMRDVLGVCD